MIEYIDYTSGIDITEELKQATTTVPYIVPYDCCIKFIFNNNDWSFYSQPNQLFNINDYLLIRVENQENNNLSLKVFLKQGQELYSASDRVNEGNNVIIYKLIE